MLQAMRSGAKSTIIKITLFGLLILAMGGLVFMDVQGVFRNSASGQMVVAKIGRDKVFAAEFDQKLRRYLQQAQLTAAEAWQQQLPQQLLEQEINSRVYGRAARDIGLLVDDATVAREVKRALQPALASGMQNEKQALQTLLSSIGMSEQAMVASVRQQIASENLIELIAGGAQPPAQMISDALKFRYEFRRGEYFTLTSADLGKLPEATPEDLQSHYRMISSRFMLPESRTLAYVTLNAKTLGTSAGANVTDEEIEEYYTQNRDQYISPDTRHIEQAVMDDEAAARAFYDAVKGGASFDAAAADKPGLRVIADSYARNDLPQELDSAAFAAPVGEVQAPVKTGLGWHVLRVTKHTPGTGKTVDDARAEIRDRLAAEKSAEDLYRKANEIDDLIAGGQTLADLTQAYGLKETLLADVEEGEVPQSVKSIQGFDKVLAAGFRLQEGKTSQLVEMPDGSLVIVEAREVVAAQPEPLEKVRAKVLADWQEKNRANLYEQKAAELTERLSLGESFDKVAASLNKKVLRTSLLQRSAMADASAADRRLVPALFSIDSIGQTTTSRAEGNGMHVLRLAERRIDMPAEPKPEDVESVRNILTRSLRNDILAQYRAGLFREYGVVIYEDVLEKLYAPQEQDAAL